MITRKPRKHTVVPQPTGAPESPTVAPQPDPTPGYRTRYKPRYELYYGPYAGTLPKWQAICVARMRGMTWKQTKELLDYTYMDFRKHIKAARKHGWMEEDTKELTPRGYYGCVELWAKYGDSVYRRYKRVPRKNKHKPAPK